MTGMKQCRLYNLLPILMFSIHAMHAQSPRQTLMLNGLVEFEQTQSSFPPEKFTRTIQVPGLIDLAMPEIEQYDDYFSGRQEPRYSWYRFRFEVSNEHMGENAVLKIRKSRYNTQVILNGHDCGTFMQCNTPIECDLTDFISFDHKNSLLIRVGERVWLPKESATGFDREKFADVPGIWDDVFITFTGPVRIEKTLVLPDLAKSKVTVKIVLENYAKEVERNMEYSFIEYTLSASIREKLSGAVVSETIMKKDKIKCQQFQELEFDIPLVAPHSWSPEDPFLYETVIGISADAKYFDDYGNQESLRPSSNYSWTGPSDEMVITFGMRDFKAVDRTFELNGSRYVMSGSTITLNRFFEDNNRGALPWDREWVKKLLIDIPKSLGWNGFRVCIGLLPDFWYDLADEYGLVLQNEYPMWNLRGRDLQYKKEYTDWVWSDGNHPSIVIWDAMNEQKQDYIGNILIPELKILDPTRIWDAGYMNTGDIDLNEMDEIHWYPLGFGWWDTEEAVQKKRESFRFGTLFDKSLSAASNNSAPMILNEYGWLWLNRDGVHSAIRTEGSFISSDITPSKINYEYFEPDGTQLYSGRDVYDYYLGLKATPQERWTFQAYLHSIEGEVLRSSRVFTGIFSFVYLTDNGGYTGDWFIRHIGDLEPAQALLAQYHTFRPFAVFIDLEDGRYLKNPHHYQPGSSLAINLLGVNDSNSKHTGFVKVSIVDQDWKIESTLTVPLEIDAFWQIFIPITLKIPEKEGGYMIISELDDCMAGTVDQISRRYFLVGDPDKAVFPEYIYKLPPEWPE